MITKRIGPYAYQKTSSLVRAQSRQQGLRRGQASLGQQLERLTEAYLGGVVLLDEYRRRRRDLEERQRQLEEQASQLEAQADRHKELAGLSGALEDFC